MLANIAKLSLKVWRHMKPRLCQGQLAVFTVEDGRISQARVVQEIENAKHRMATSTKGGVASGVARRKKSAVLRERMMNSTSNSSSTPLRTPVELEDEPKANRKRTSHESRSTSHEVRSSKISELSLASPSLFSALSESDDRRPGEIIRRILKPLAPKMKQPSDATVKVWLSIAPSIWHVAAAAILKSDHLTNAQSAAYLTTILRECAANGGFF